ncbi:MAG TPA: carboxypeptidase-like regulatory domain-containing protein [Candidatus Angelobacter sp.]|nr:carboxypeptidase-like regulatory domain-containing protein [Candidatus Angelobacter sp.]
MNCARSKIGVVATTLLVCTLTGCEGGTLLDGKITDAAGNPVVSAIVTLEVVEPPWDKAQEKSDAHGKYKINVTHYPKRTHLVVTVSKEGFEPFEKKITSKGIHQHLEVRLKPLQTSEPPGQ